MVTWCSCIASSSAACTLAGARLISSARMICAKSGPFLTWNSCVFWSKTIVPITSAGSRSGVNWMREKEAWMISASVRTASVLARPGHALEQDVAAGQQADQQPLDHGVLPDDPAGDFLEDALHGQRLGRLVGQLRRAHAGWLLRVECGKDSRARDVVGCGRGCAARDSTRCSRRRSTEPAVSLVLRLHPIALYSAVSSSGVSGR